MIAFSIPGEPVAFARAGANGKMRFTPTRQRDFMGVVKIFAHSAMKGEPPMVGPLSMAIRATYIHPQSWSAKKMAAIEWKTSKPDADNIAKLIKDALNKIAYLDDAQISELTIQKKYGPVASLTVTIMELGNAKRD